MMTYKANDDKPNFKKCLEEANTILLASPAINDFPFSSKKVIKYLDDINYSSYYKAGTYGIPEECFKSNDALIMRFGDRYIIFYNDKITNKKRIKFSMCHELGHYFLGHPILDGESFKVIEDQYDKYEIEANFFAAQALMPEQVINELIKRGKDINIKNLQIWFGVSAEAAKKRIETLEKIDFSRRTYEQQDVDELILSKFKGFIDDIAPIYSYYYDTFEDDEELQNERDKWDY